ncbi:MAG: nitroreductase [Pseudohongiellaceae bacterium]|jgi:nitroreductase
MNVIEALKARHSVRQFKKDPIPDVVLNKILNAANESPSNCNSQPYKIAIAQGRVIEQLRAELHAKFIHASKLQKQSLPGQLYTLATKGGLPDGDFKVATKYPKELQKRRQKTGFGLYQTLGISRSDRNARTKQMARNFTFFDAPVAVFIFVHEELNHWATLDAGIYLQSLMLAATAEGIGSCAQGALATWASPIRKHFKVEKGYKLLVGVSLGYEADHIVNSFKPDRAHIQEMIFKQNSSH